MNVYHQMYESILNGDEKRRRAATLQLPGIVQVAATAILELAGSEKLKTGVDPLVSRSRLILSEFIGLDED